MTITIYVCVTTKERDAGRALSYKFTGLAEFVLYLF